MSGIRNSRIPENIAVEAPLKDGGDFDLRVVGPGGNPIPEALVELRTSPAPTAEQVRRGKFVRASDVRTFLATDGEGRLVVAFPKVPPSLDVDITIPGYGPYWAGWSSEDHAEAIPSRLTAELEAAWSVGGIIVDAEGKPVEGATVRPSIEFKKRPGDVQASAPRVEAEDRRRGQVALRQRAGLDGRGPRGDRSSRLHAPPSAVDAR